MAGEDTVNNMKTYIGILLIALFSAGICSAEGQDELSREISLYSDLKARNIGDVLSVIISESNSATNNTKTSTKKQGATSLKGTATTGALGGLFTGMDGSLDTSNQFSGQGGTQRNGSFTSRMAVTVIDVLPGGNLVIQGTKTMELNSETEVITVSGTIKPQDISSDNTIYSYQVADAKILYKGKGVSEEGHRPGLLMRLFNWIM